MNDWNLIAHTWRVTSVFVFGWLNVTYGRETESISEITSLRQRRRKRMVKRQKSLNAEHRIE